MKTTGRIPYENPIPLLARNGVLFSPGHGPPSGLIDIRAGRVSGGKIANWRELSRGFNVADRHKEYDVRGIIILREKDERLEYALSMMPKVSLFKYEVYFKINKLK